VFQGFEFLKFHTWELFDSNAEMEHKNITRAGLNQKSANITGRIQCGIELDHTMQ